MTISSTDDPLGHLPLAVRSLVDLSDAERRRIILSDRWIGYPLAMQTVRRVEELLRRPRVSRMRSLLVLGPSGMGKTLIRRKLERDHAEGFAVPGSAAPHPLISLQLPPRPDERRFYAHLLDQLGAPPRPRDTLDQIEVSALRLLRHLRPAALMLDEFQHVGASGARDVQAMLNLVKFLANELEMPVIAFGTDAALHVLKMDTQVDSRFDKHSLPVWRDSEAFADLVSSIMAAMPLRRPSAVQDRALVRALLKLSGGVTGDVFHLLTTAAATAVGGEERITHAGIHAAAAGEWQALV